MSSVAATFDWAYSSPDPEVLRLERAAEQRRWSVETDIPWELPVDPGWSSMAFPLAGLHAYETLSPDAQRALRAELCGYMVSQLLHGEQGALVASGQVVAAIPAAGSKRFASAQAQDEARHMAVFSRYLTHARAPRYPVAGELGRLLDWIVGESRWDYKLLGMNVIIEGLAMAILATMQHVAGDAVLIAICRRVLSDEARHLAFGAHALAQEIRGAPDAATREREDFVYEACVLMRDRLLFQDVWERAELDTQVCLAHVRNHPHQRAARRILFSQILRVLGNVGLLSPRLVEMLAGLEIGPTPRGVRIAGSLRA
jgi:hypothetical protein